MTIKVVIGAGFGDEGKGLMTDYFASQAENTRTLVVRFNGGSQAAHTVVTPEGKRHVFGHFGSGTLAGLPTYLSDFFVVNPILFSEELSRLKALGVTPKVYVDKNCIVTTPYDIMLNQLIETVRGEGRHGSIGVGFNETIERSENFLKITMIDLLPGNKHSLQLKLRAIEELYVDYRRNELDILTVPTVFNAFFADTGAILRHYLEDIKNLLGNVELVDVNILHSFDNVIFEGAQGLLLGQTHEYFPHVTRSNTGLKNVVSILKSSDLTYDSVDVTYVTRCYATRHGVGPFPYETSSPPFTKIEDLTNIPNEYQGALRFGLLDLNALTWTIRNDMLSVLGENFIDEEVVFKLAITCLDQVGEGEEIRFIFRATECSASVDEFVKTVFKVTDLGGGGYLSYGPTRNTISVV